jgi:hypothetical protein
MKFDMGVFTLAITTEKSVVAFFLAIIGKESSTVVRPHVPKTFQAELPQQCVLSFSSEGSSDDYQ